VTPRAPAEQRFTGWDWLGVALLTGCGALAALLEALLVPLYLGSVVFPVAVVLALVSNVVLPWLAHQLTSSTAAMVAPLAVWLIVVFGFGGVSRPEGDVILPGSPNTLEFVTYGVLLGGAVAGLVTVLMLTTAKPRPKG
jgi:MFS-type transporter involved in bile tolerance (Atg22 family)